MKRSMRLTVFGCAAALALAVTAIAAASYTPSMGIFQATYKPSSAGVVTIVVAQEKVDDPTARIVIYAPLGYKATLTQAPGTQIGTRPAPGHHTNGLPETTRPSVPLVTEFQFITTSRIISANASVTTAK